MAGFFDTHFGGSAITSRMGNRFLHTYLHRTAINYSYHTICINSSNCFIGTTPTTYWRILINRAIDECG